MPAKHAPQCHAWSVIEKDELYEIRLNGLEKLAGGGKASEVEVNDPDSAMTPRRVTLAPSATAATELICLVKTDCHGAHVQRQSN